MTKLLRKFYKAKCIAPISIHGIGECIVGKTYTLDEDQAKYNGGAFDIKNAEVNEEVVKMDDFGNDADPVMTKEQLVNKEMEDNSAVARAKEAEAAAEMGMTVEDYRDHVASLRKPMAKVAEDREGRGKQLAKMNKEPLESRAKELGIAPAEGDTRAILIDKILAAEFKVLP